MNTWSRAIPFDKDTAKPGDRINTANDDRPPYWLELVAVGECSMDADELADCDGDCAFVLHLKPLDECDVEFWHVEWSEVDRVQTSLPAVAA